MENPENTGRFQSGIFKSEDLVLSSGQNPYERVVEDNYDGLKGFIARKIGHQGVPYDDREDVAHEVLAKMWEKVSQGQSFDHGEMFLGWCSRISVNTSINFYRRTGRRETVELDNDVVSSSGLGTEDQAIVNVQLEEAAKKVHDLPKRSKAAVEKYAFEGKKLTARERVALYRARKRLSLLPDSI